MPHDRRRLTPLNHPTTPGLPPNPFVGHLLLPRHARCTLNLVTHHASMVQRRALDTRPLQCQVLSLTTRSRTQTIVLVLAVKEVQGPKGPKTVCRLETLISVLLIE